MIEKDKIDRHIIAIVQNASIKEQSDLQDLLQERGYDIPQATLSRKLKKLNIAKIAGIYKIINMSTRNVPVVLNMQTSDFGIIVLHTHPGNANSLAAYIDEKYVDLNKSSAKHSGILGTLAGDDTVLVVMKNKEATENIMKTFSCLFPYLESCNK